MATIQGIEQQKYCIWEAGCQPWGRNLLAGLWQNSHHNTNASQTSLGKNTHISQQWDPNLNVANSAATFSGTIFDASAKKTFTPMLCTRPAVYILHKQRRPCFKYCLGSKSINQGCLIGVESFFVGSLVVLVSWNNFQFDLKLVESNAATVQCIES